jgi:hypothetical protein
MLDDRQLLSELGAARATALGDVRALEASVFRARTKATLSVRPITSPKHTSKIQRPELRDHQDLMRTIM